jgi:hypothetical protein
VTDQPQDYPAGVVLGYSTPPEDHMEIEPDRPSQRPTEPDPGPPLLPDEPEPPAPATKPEPEPEPAPEPKA